MNKIQIQDITEYFDVTRELIPYIPELLADLWALGSSPELIVEWLRPLGLPPNSTHVLDAGCGKGAVAITLAKEFDFQVLGVDFFQPFVSEAKEKARERGVAGLCQFEYADIRDTLRKTRDFDIVIYAAVDGVLGEFNQCVGQLRQSIRPGGYMIIDDGFLATTTKIEFPGYEHYVSREETLLQLTSHGDTLLREKISSAEDMKALNRRNTKLISKRAEQLAQRHPEIADSFLRYVEQQKRESKILETEMSSAVWLIQKV